MLSRIKFEIDPLVKEILDQLPAEVWTSATTTFFDPAIGGGQFVRAIEQRLVAAGHAAANIKKRVFGLEESKLNICYAYGYARDKYKYNLAGTYSASKFLLKDFDNMKFDVVLGNPPYQKTTEHGKKVNDNLWAPLTFKAWELVKDNGHLCFVTPDGWRTPTNDFRTERKSIFKEIISAYSTIAVNMNECEKYFSVGSTISYFVVQKKKNTGMLTSTKSKFGTTMLDVATLPLIPKDLSVNGVSIFLKVMRDTSKRWAFSQKQTKLNKSLHVTETKDSNQKFKFFDSHGSANIKFCDKMGENHKDSKIMITYVGKYKALADDGTITPAQHVHRQIISPNEIIGAESQLNSKLYRFIIEGNRSNQYIEKHIPNMMPQLALSINWTDAKIYNHFSLTQEEIEYVEANYK